MAVLSYREVLPRSYSHKLGGSPEASCVWVATLDEPTSSSAIIGAIGIQHGTPHPDNGNLTCDNISVEETDRHHATVTYSYSVPDKQDPENPDQPPWMQPDRWAFGTTNASVACTHYYRGVGNGNRKRLVNTAGDVIVGISMAEAELKISISGARLTFDLANTKKLVNTINSVPWAGFPRHTVQCVGVSATPDKLEWEGQVVKFWQINIELIYRSTSHNLKLPNVGWHVIVNGKRERAWTYITEKGVRYKVPSPHQVALNAAGGFLCGQDQDDAPNWNGGTSTPDDGTEYYGG